MAGAIRTVQRWADDSGLSRSMIDDAVKHGHLDVLIDAQPRMIEESAWERWIRNGRKTQPEGRRKLPESSERQVAVGAAPERADGALGYGRDQKGGKGERARKGRKAKPTLYYIDPGGSLESPGA